jgi:hypothetical protein
MMRAVLGKPTGSPVVVSIGLLLTISAAPVLRAQGNVTAPAQPVAAPATTAPAAPAAPAPAAVSGQASVETNTSLTPEAVSGDEDAHLAWDLANRRYASWAGPTGGIFLFDARGAEPGAVRVQLGLDAFAASDYLTPDDHVELSGQSLALSVTALRQLEFYATLSNRSGNQSKPTASTLDTIGDVSLGGRIGTRLGQLLDVGADLRGTFTNKLGGGGFDWGATSAALRAALSIDLERLERPIPLLVRFNVGYVLDNSGVLIEDYENERYNALTNAKDKADETKHLVSRFQRLAMNVNRLDRLALGVGVELPLQVAERFYLHPILEWQLGVPVNRQSYDCPFEVGASNIGETKGPDGCYERNTGSMPMNLGFGVRVVPPVRGLSALLGVDIGLTGTSKFVRELAPNLPWRVLVAFSYDYDARPVAPAPALQPVAPVLPPPPPPPPAAAPSGRIQGTVTAPDNRAIADARVRYVGLKLTDLITGAEGHFATEPLPPGPVSLEVSAADYQTASCSATIAAEGGDVPLRCTLAPQPLVATFQGQINESSGAPVPAARVIVIGPTNSVLLSDATGAFKLENQPPGSYQVRVEAGGYFIRQQSFTVDKRGTLPLSFSLTRKPIAPTIVFVGDGIDAPSITYATDSATQPLAAGSGALAEIADFLLSRPDLYLQIQGFGPSNELGLARAQVLRQRLIDAGVAANHIEAVGGGTRRLRFLLHR